jgi:homoserine dehydrogenase
MTQALRLGLVGLGAVGAATVRRLQEQADLLADRAGRPLQLVAVSARDAGKNRGVALDAYRWYADPLELAAAPDLDVVIELIGGAEGTARAVVTAALTQGKAVVTANKALLATHGLTLGALAAQQQVPLLFEAAVAGGVPIIKTIREALAANRISQIRGVLNGTCNDILSRMAREDCDFPHALQAAQAAGYAEADPTQDIDGYDPAQKMTILAMLAFGVALTPEQVKRSGIRHLTRHDVLQARRDGKIIRLVACATQHADGTIHLSVAPEMLLPHDPLAQLQGPMNAVIIQADLVGQLILTGAGAGGDATASAVIADVLDVARQGSACGNPFPVKLRT